MRDAVVDALAVARITRLVVEDRVPFGKLRERLTSRAWKRALDDGEAHSIALTEGKSYVDGEEPYLVELLSCPWCASIWVGFGVLLVRRLPGWRPLAEVLAASEIAGLAATYVDR
jgi:hypothetical protein